MIEREKFLVAADALERVGCDALERVGCDEVAKLLRQLGDPQNRNVATLPNIEAINQAIQLPEMLVSTNGIGYLIDGWSVEEMRPGGVCRLQVRLMACEPI